MTDGQMLSKRSIPFMVLSDGSPSSLTAPPAPFPRELKPQDRAVARFAVEGNVVVTGGARGLGLSAARALLEHGARGCCIWDLEATLRGTQAQMVALAQDFPAARVFGVAVDVTRAAEVTEAVAAAVQSLGSIEHLFCFAGIAETRPAFETEEEQWQQLLAVNTTGAFVCARAVARQMIAQQTRSSSITLIASVAGHKTSFPQPQVAYGASKAAVLSIRKSLAAEWAVHGIRVNSISPGYMDTVLTEGEGLTEARETWCNRIPMGRMGNPEEVNGMCVLLASRAGSYITGADVVIDGGLSVF